MFCLGVRPSNNLFVSLAGGGVWLSGVLHSLAGVVHEFHRFLFRGRSAKMAAPPLAENARFSQMCRLKKETHSVVT